VLLLGDGLERLGRRILLLEQPLEPLVQLLVVGQVQLLLLMRRRVRRRGKLLLLLE
jgi:hypothetical protein